MKNISTKEVVRAGVKGFSTNGREEARKTLTGIFLDTGKLEEIRKYLPLGIIRGVTTNPTILVKDGARGGMAGVESRCKEIAELVAPWPLSVEVVTNNPKEMLDQARAFSSWARNINVKITIHGPEGGDGEPEARP